METTTKKQALQNAVNSLNVEGIELKEYIQHDKRKTTERFILTDRNVKVSPVLDYTQMNHFILGYYRALTRTP